MIDRSIALPWVWLNGGLTKSSTARVSVFDRCFTLGDGIFDTLRILDNRPLQWRAHWRRFSQTAKQFRFTIPFTETECLAAFQTLLKKNKVSNAIVRIQLSRGVSPRGYSIARASSPTAVISLHPPHDITPGKPNRWKLKVASIPFPNCAQLSQHKTTSRTLHVAAKLEADSAGFDDALLLNDRGDVMEAISSNVFWLSGETVFTPPLRLGILPGTTRNQILKLCRRRKLVCREETVHLKKLLAADAVFLSVSTSGIIEIVQIDRTKLNRHPIVAVLHALLENSHLQEAKRSSGKNQLVAQLN